MAGQDLALLVTAPPTGRRFSELGDGITDEAITAGWNALDQLHSAGITHGSIGPEHLLVADDGTVAFADLGAGEVTIDPYRRNRDVAALLVTTSLLLGDDEAVGPEPAPVSDARCHLGPAAPTATDAPAAPKHSRAIGLAVAALGPERIGAAIPLVQPAALAVGGRTRHQALRASR